MPRLQKILQINAFTTISEMISKIEKDLKLEIEFNFIKI